MIQSYLTSARKLVEEEPGEGASLLVLEAILVLSLSLVNALSEHEELQTDHFQSHPFQTVEQIYFQKFFWKLE